MALTAERLREVAHYDPETGVFTRLQKTAPQKPIGAVLGGLQVVKGQKRIRISVDSRRYFAHRLAWLYMTGEWPPEDVDHVNGDGTDNRWTNLRCANRTQNHGNRVLRSDSRNGLKGVEKVPNCRSWAARIQAGHRRVYLGSFPTKEEAHLAYMRAAERMFGEFACDGKRN